ncbi:hypothetical protein ACFWFI_03350 [Streptomyces sp. NPDC060209]|uniref:hypothetical protein n=1 Tax=Streptomyces sp. NPDC060209 TaxID=3347073 RepID=UPI00366929DA
MAIDPPYTGVQHDQADETPLHGPLHRGQEAAIEAVLTADAVLIATFPGTLSPAITLLAWTGYPSAEGPCLTRHAQSPTSAQPTTSTAGGSTTPSATTSLAKSSTYCLSWRPAHAAPISIRESQTKTR